MEKVTIEEIRLLLKYMSKGYKLPKILHDEVFNAAKREIEEKKRVILIKRDPDVEAGRLQARLVKVVDGNTMEMHPATVGPFGADFDGDTMAMYAPMSEEAQNEARSKMISATRNSGINAPMFDLSNEMISGLFSITYPTMKGTPVKISDLEEAKKMKFGDPVIYKGITTTAGRVIFNSGLPVWFPFVNEAITKGGVKKLLAKVMEKSQNDFVHSVDNLMDMGFHYATVNPLSYSIDQMTLSPELIQLKKRLSTEKDVSMQSKIIKQMEIALLEHLKKEVPELYMTAFSGASKDVGQLRQIMVCKGLIADPMGNILPPIMTAIGDGYSPEEYFAASAGSRTGTISRAILTAHGGYSARKVMYVTSNVTLSTTTKNCNTKEGLNIKLTPKLFAKMRGRYVIGEDGEVHPIDAKMIGQKIKLRSPVRCKTNEICHICYGELHKQLDTRNIGIAAALNLNVAEKIMKSFHTGGSVNLMPVDIIGFEIMGGLDDVFKPTVDKNVRQEGNDLVLSTDYVAVRLSKTDYLNTPFTRDKDMIVLPVGYFTMNFHGLSTDLTIEQETILYLTENIEENDEFIEIIYDKDDKIFTVYPVAKKYDKLAATLDRNIGGKTAWGNSPDMLYMKFLKSLYILDEGYDSVHIEVLLSNILRNSENPQKPARLVEPYSPKLFSVKALPSIISWPLGLAFENFSSAIQAGMISERSPSSPIEKILFGESLLDIPKKNK